MAVSVAKLGESLYEIVARAIRTGVPVEIERKGERVRLERVKRKAKLGNLVRRPGTIAGDPEELVHMDCYTAQRGV